MRTASKLWSLAVIGAACGVAGSPPTPTHTQPGAGQQTGERPSELTAAECQYWESSGTVNVCHATGSASNPYTLIKVSTAACVNGHQGHRGDYVATAEDPNCTTGGGCYPVGAPADPNVPCCGGAVNVNGQCACPSGEVLDPASGTCVATYRWVQVSSTACIAGSSCSFPACYAPHTCEATTVGNYVWTYPSPSSLPNPTTDGSSNFPNYTPGSAFGWLITWRDVDGFHNITLGTLDTASTCSGAGGIWQCVGP